MCFKHKSHACVTVDHESHSLGVCVSTGIHAVIAGCEENSGSTDCNMFFGYVIGKRIYQFEKQVYEFGTAAKQNAGPRDFNTAHLTTGQRHLCITLTTKHTLCFSCRAVAMKTTAEPPELNTKGVRKGIDLQNLPLCVQGAVRSWQTNCLVFKSAGSLAKIQGCKSGSGEETVICNFWWIPLLSAMPVYTMLSWHAGQQVGHA